MQKKLKIFKSVKSHLSSTSLFLLYGRNLSRKAYLARTEGFLNKPQVFHQNLDENLKSPKKFRSAKFFWFSKKLRLSKILGLQTRRMPSPRSTTVSG